MALHYTLSTREYCVCQVSIFSTQFAAESSFYALVSLNSEPPEVFVILSRHLNSVETFEIRASIFIVLTGDKAADFMICYGIRCLRSSSKPGGYVFPVAYFAFIKPIHYDVDAAAASYGGVQHVSCCGCRC